MKRIRQESLVLLLCLLVFCVSLAYGIWSGPELRWQDENEYHQLAEGLRQYGAYEKSPDVLTSFRPPGYPFVLTVIYQAWHSTIAAKIVNAVALGATAVLAAMIVSGVVAQGAVFAPLLLLFYPVFVYTSGTLYPQTLGTFLLVAAIACLVLKPGSSLLTALSGILYGDLILMIPSFLLTLPVVVLALLAHERRLRGGFRMTALFGVCAVLAVLPWTIRNAIQFHELIPVSSNSGINLLLGNSPLTGPNSGVNVDLSRYYGLIPSGAPISEKSADDYYLRFALQWIISEPAAATRLYLLKTLNYFNFRNELATSGRGGGAVDVLLFATYYPLLALALARIAFRKKFPFTFTETLLYVLYFSNALIAAVFFTRIRFRLPFDALLVIMVSMYLGHLVADWRSRRKA